MDDSIPICRSVFNHWIYEDAEFLKSWITMLGRAQFTKEPKNKIYMGIAYTLNRGEFIFGRQKWSKDAGISEERLRRLITLLLRDSMISLVAFKGKFTIYKIVNYEKFNQQSSRKTKGATGDSPPADTITDPPTDPQQTPQQSTTNEEGIKNGKNVIVSSKRKNTVPVSEFVYLTEAEIEELKSKHGEIGYARIISILDSYKGNADKKTYGKDGYKDDRRVITQWVEKKYFDERPLPAPQQSKIPDDFWKGHLK
jgi:hypothetical protein